MKFCLVILCSCLVCTSLTAQDFAGYRTGNYTGVNGVFFNPANIADSRYRWDVNLVTLSTLAGNNQASFRLRNLKNAFNSDSLQDQLFGKNAGTSSGIVSTDVHGPSFMLRTGKKMAFAFTTRARVMGNVADVDGKLLNKLTDDFSNDPQLPYSISSAKNMRVTVNAWSEFGLSAARVLLDNKEHFIKAGVTLKYLAGAANAYININGFNGVLNADYLAQDVYLSNASGRIAAGFGGVRISDFDANQLTKMESHGVGGDVGIVYEYRPDYAADQEVNGYKLKLSLSLLDFGSIRYKKDLQRSGSYNIDITGNEKLYFAQLNGLNVDDYKSFFNSKPQLFTPVAGNEQTSYTVALPSTLNAELDYHVHQGFYVHLGSQFSLTSSDGKLFNSNYYNSITLTPRYEGKKFGFFIPLNYNQLTKFNAGLSLRAGPFFVGSGSILTALTGDSKQADVHVGVRFGGLYRKHS